MSNSILITDEGISLNELKQFLFENIPFSLANASLSFEKSNSFINIMEDRSMIKEFDDEELLLITKNIKNPRFYIIDSNDFELLKLFIDNIPDEIAFLIDNDHGKIMNKKTFVNFKSFSDFFSW